MDKQVYKIITEVWKITKQWLQMDWSKDKSWMQMREDCTRVYKSLETEDELINDFASDLIVMATKLIEDDAKRKGVTT